MAEIRKHNPQIRDEIDKAIHAALGEDIRPVQQREWTAPSAPRAETFAARAPGDDRPAAAAAPAAFGAFAPGQGALGWTTLDPTKVAKPLGVKRPASDDDEDDDEDAVDA